MFDYLVAHGRMKEKEARAKFRQVCICPLLFRLFLPLFFLSLSLLSSLHSLSFLTFLSLSTPCMSLFSHSPRSFFSLTSNSSLSPLSTPSMSLFSLLPSSLSYLSLSTFSLSPLPQNYVGLLSRSCLQCSTAIRST